VTARFRPGFSPAFGAAFGLGIVLLGQVNSASSAEAWSDTYTSRLEALALLQSLNADLLSHDSATLTLDRWCDVHHLASPAKVVAERVKDADKPPTPEVRQALAVGESDLVRYRRVRLKCGEHVLSEADNWYVPKRLTADMNTALETTDVAFGRAVQALHFQRRTVKATLLWAPLPEGWEMGTGVPPTAHSAPKADAANPEGAKAAAEKADGRRADAGTAGALEVPGQVLQHQAVLSTPDGTPFSMVIETYTSAVLAFPEPGPKTPPR